MEESERTDERASEQETVMPTVPWHYLSLALKATTTTEAAAAVTSISRWSEACCWTYPSGVAVNARHAVVYVPRRNAMKVKARRS